MSKKLARTKQARFAVASCITVLAFAVAFWSLSTLENGKLQAEFDTKMQLLHKLQADGSELGLSSSSTETMFAEVPGPTETIAASVLQKRLLEIAVKSKVAIHSIQTQTNAESSDQSLRRINCELAFDGTIEALQRLLFEVETSVPFIFVDTISAQSFSASAKNEAGDITLRVTLNASAYWKGQQVEANSQ